MNCNEARDLLSEYIDQTLIDAERESVEAHLSTCSECREGKEALAQLVADVARLDTIEAPPGFSQRVMSKVREESKPSILERVFLPLKVKIPIQVVGLFLVAGLAVYLYRINPLVQEEISQMAPLDSNRSVPATPLPSVDSDLKEQRNEKEEQEVVSIQRFATTEKKREISSEILDKPGARKKLLREGSPRGPTSAMAPSSNQMGAGADRIVEPAVKAQKQFVAADIEWIFVPDAPIDMEDTRQKLEIFIQEIGGSSVKQNETSAQFRKRDIIPEDILWITLPELHLTQLKNKLATFGNITSDELQSSIDSFKPLQEALSLDEAVSKPSASKKQNTSLRIKLIIR